MDLATNHRDARGSSSIPHMHNLPLELFDMIMKLLQDDAPALSSSSLVCRAWSKVAQYHLFLDVVLNITRLKSFKHIFPRCGSTRRLEIQIWPDIEKPEHLNFLHRFPRLTHLTLSTRLCLFARPNGRTVSSRGHHGTFLVQSLVLRIVSFFPTVPGQKDYSDFQFFPAMRVLRIYDACALRQCRFPLPKQLAIEDLTLHHFIQGSTFLESLVHTKTGQEGTLKTMDIAVATSRDLELVATIQSWPLSAKCHVRSLRIEAKLVKLISAGGHLHIVHHSYVNKSFYST